MKWLGLTGGIASGKSTVSQALRKKGFPVLDADEIAHQVVQIGSPGLKSIVTKFGPDVLSSDGSLDRRKLGQIIFGNTELKRGLESILHPLIREEIDRQRQALAQQGELLAIYDIPLLFETKSQAQFDYIIVVTCTLTQQKQRLKLRNSLSEQEIDQRIAAQIPLRVKESEADFVLHNDQDDAFLHSEIERLVRWLERLKVESKKSE